MAILIMLAFITLFKTHNHYPVATMTHELSRQTIHVTIKGAVSKAGEYELKKGLLVKDLLALAGPLPDADLSKLKLEARLRDHQLVKIPQEQWITVHLKGAVVNPGTLKVKLGTALKDLPTLTELLPEANKEKLYKKRRLKDGEVVEVVLIKVPSNSKKKQKSNPI